jgi:hypothetical protein
MLTGAKGSLKGRACIMDAPYPGQSSDSTFNETSLMNGLVRGLPTLTIYSPKVSGTRLSGSGIDFHHENGLEDLDVCTCLMSS